MINVQKKTARTQEVQEFISYLENEKRDSLHTIVAYKTDLLQFFCFLERNLEKVVFSKITMKMVRMWLVAEMNGEFSDKSNLQAASVKRKLTSVKVFFRYLLERGKVETNPAEGIFAPKIPTRLPIFIPEDQMKRMLDQMDKENACFKSLRDRLVLLLAYETGMRRSEIVNLRMNDVDFSRKIVRVKGKREKEREIPLLDELIEDMQCYLEKRKEVVECEHGMFFVTDNGSKIDPGFVYRLVVKKIRQYTTLSKGGPHVLRHTFATHLLNEGGSVEGIKELLGHSNLAATQVYTHNSVGDMLKIFNQAHPRA